MRECVSFLQNYLYVDVYCDFGYLESLRVSKLCPSGVGLGEKCVETSSACKHGVVESVKQQRHVRPVSLITSQYLGHYNASIYQ